MIHTFKPNLTGKAAKYVNVPPGISTAIQTVLGLGYRGVLHTKDAWREIGIFSDAAQYTMYYVNDTFP